MRQTIQTSLRLFNPKFALNNSYKGLHKLISNNKFIFHRLGNILNRTRVFFMAEIMWWLLLWVKVRRMNWHQICTRLVKYWRDHVVWCSLTKKKAESESINYNLSINFNCSDISTILSRKILPVQALRHPWTFPFQLDKLPSCPVPSNLNCENSDCQQNWKMVQIIHNFIF